MIQRIQSIWLFLAALSISCLLFLPIATTTDLIGMKFTVVATGLYQEVGGVKKQVESFLPLLISVSAVAIMCIVNIFNFRKRKLQKQVAYASIVLIIGLSFWCSQYAKKIPGGVEVANYGAGMYVPPLAIAFCLLAIRGINRDEALLRSADRLR